MIREGLGGKEKRQGLASEERGFLSKVESEKGFWREGEKTRLIASEEQGFLSKVKK